MNRSGAVWTMAKRNLRRGWARNLLLAVILTLAIAGDVLVGLFFSGLEAKAESLVPPGAQNVNMLVMAPDWVNMPSLVSWARLAGGFYGSGFYRSAETVAWTGCFTPTGRTQALYLDFTSSLLQPVQLQGRWPFSGNEIALPTGKAAEWGVGIGSQVNLALGEDPAQVRSLTVTGLFLPQAIVVRQDGRSLRRETYHDPALDFPLLALYPDGSEQPAVPLNAGLIDAIESEAKTLEGKIINYVRREYPAQPATARFAASGLTILRPRSGPERAEAIGKVVFSPGGRALAAGFLFVGVGIFVILLIAFIERKREFAVLKTVGMNNSMVLAMVMMELASVAAVALVAGSALAAGVGGTIARAVEYVPAPTVGAWLSAVLHTGAVLVLAAMLPLSMARLATVQQLLQNEKLYLRRKRVTLS